MDELGWGVGNRSIPGGGAFKGLLRAAGKHWELLRGPVSPSDSHSFEPRHEVLSTLSPSHITGTHIQPPAICNLSRKKKGNQTVVNRKTQGGASLSNCGMEVGFKAIFSIFNGWKAA